MAPGIHNGDFAFIDTTQLKINADALYALQYGGSIFIKVRVLRNLFTEEVRQQI